MLAAAAVIRTLIEIEPRPRTSSATRHALMVALLRGRSNAEHQELQMPPVSFSGRFPALARSALLC
jgi:hypothetical protein